MSEDPTFKNILNALANNPDSAVRIEAAQTLGNYVDQLTDAEYEAARSALDKALTDPDPMVLMAAMNAMTAYNRRGASALVEEEETVEDEGAAQAAVCSVCGKPEALIADGGCGRDDCPYQ